MTHNCMRYKRTCSPFGPIIPGGPIGPLKMWNYCKMYRANQLPEDRQVQVFLERLVNPSDLADPKAAFVHNTFFSIITGSPIEPGTPERPSSPFVPFSPHCPFGPGGPGNPGGPIPRSPLIPYPGSPCGPRSPAIPWMPCGPGRP